MDLWALRRLVSQRSLKSCRLAFEDRPLEDASLFPLFDEEGRTRMVMITAEENARIMLADWAPGLFVRDWPWRNRLRLRFTDLDDASVWDEERLDDLWHFDPWWVLGEERYQGHGSVPRQHVHQQHRQGPPPSPTPLQQLCLRSFFSVTAMLNSSADEQLLQAYTIEMVNLPYALVAATATGNARNSEAEKARQKVIEKGNRKPDL
jgi:hypothetical protein